MKKGIIAIIGGVLLPILSTIPFVLNVMHIIKNAPPIGIIGGADAPTTLFIITTLLEKHFYSLCFIALMGLALIVLGIVLIVMAKTKKSAE